MGDGSDSPLGKDWAKGLLEGDEDEEEGADGMLAGPSKQTGPFGLGLGPVDEALRAQTGLDAGTGVLVRAVRPDSPAAKLGLQPFDVLTAVNGTKVGSSEQVRNLIRAVKAEDPFSVEVVRAGKTLTLKR